MARTWFAGYPTAPSKDPKGAVSNKDDSAQSHEGVVSKNKIAVNNFAPAYQTTLTKAIHTDSESDGSVTWVTPFTSPQKELSTQPTKEAIVASTYLARLIQQHSKSKGSLTADTSKEATMSKPMDMMDTYALSSSAPRRAPTAQMVPLTPNAAVTTVPAATGTAATSTASLFGPRVRAMSISSPQAFFLSTDSSSALLSSPPSVLRSSPTPSAKKPMPRKSLQKTPKITLTPAPATAPSAFKDAALAAHVQNTKLLTPVKQQTNGVTKRQCITTSSPPESQPTPEFVPEEKRGRGRPRTRTEEQPLAQSKQHRPPIQACTPHPQTISSAQSNPSQSKPSASPLQQQQIVTLNTNGDLTPQFCSEEPRLWPRRGDYVTSLLHFDSLPETAHSEPIQICSNHAAHKDPQKAHGHPVCTTCRNGAFRHIRATRPDLFLAAWWPLCKACGEHELLHIDASRIGCSCGKKWLCLACLVQEMEMRKMKIRVEAEFRRRTFVGEGMDGGVKTVFTGWACECGENVEPDATVVKCAGCQGMRVNKPGSSVVTARDYAFAKNALKWT